MYWQDREYKAQENLTNKNIKEIEKQLGKYYKHTSSTLRGQFLITYNALLSSIDEGMKPTPADLYKLDKYWKLQTLIRDELQKLGEKETALYIKHFIEQWKDTYNLFAFKDDNHFNVMDDAIIEQMIKQIWCSDGMSWSQRIWKNTEKLQQALNDGLIDCVLTGRSTAQLKDMLMHEFNVSYNRADSIVRTEMLHIQTQAAQQRYKDAGISEVMVWADKDERRCEVCGKLHKKKFPINATMPIPAHPRCRCRIIAVIE